MKEDLSESARIDDFSNDSAVTICNGYPESACRETPAIQAFVGIRHCSDRLLANVAAPTTFAV